MAFQCALQVHCLDSCCTVEIAGLIPEGDGHHQARPCASHITHRPYFVRYLAVAWARETMAVVTSLVRSWPSMSWAGRGLIDNNDPSLRPAKFLYQPPAPPPQPHRTHYPQITSTCKQVLKKTLHWTPVVLRCNQPAFMEHPPLHMFLFLGGK